MRIKRLVITAIITLMFGICMNELFMPTWNLKASGTWLFLFCVLTIGGGISGILDYFFDTDYANTAFITIAAMICLLIYVYGISTSVKLY